MKNGNGNGCIVGILVFCFLGGNALLFSGMKELENNPFAILMVIFSVCTDVFLASFLIKIVAKSIKKNKSNQFNERKNKDNTQTIKTNVAINIQRINPNNNIPDNLEKTTVISKEKTNKLGAESEPDINFNKKTVKSSSVTITKKSTYQSLFNVLLALYNQRSATLYNTLVALQNKEKKNSPPQAHNTNKLESDTVVSVIQKPNITMDDKKSAFDEETFFIKADDESIIPGMEEEKRDKYEPMITQDKEVNISWGSIVLPDMPVKTYEPEKIIRDKPPIVELIHSMDKITIKNEPSYPKGFYSRNKLSDETSAKNAQLFYKQALFMANVEDDYKGKDNSYPSWHSTFEWMDLQEKRTYFTWRTHIRKGEYIKAKPQYIFIYLSELINNIPYDENTEKRFDYFLKFVTNLELYIDDSYTYYYRYEINEWLISFYVLNDISYSKYEFNQRLPDEYRYKKNEYYYIPKSQKYSESKELLNRYSNYKFLSSIFYESEYGYLLLEAIDYVFRAVEDYLKKFRIIWFDAIYNSIEYEKTEWHPYKNLTYYPGAQISDREVELVNGDKYIIKDGKGYKLYHGYNPNPYSGAIAYTIKIIENELRKALGFRAKLHPNSSTVTSNYYYDPRLIKKYEKRLNKFCSEDYRRMVEEKSVEFFDSTGIERMVMSKTYQRKKEMERQKAEKAKHKDTAKASQRPIPVVLEIDRSKFESIRRVSEEIQSALIIEEDNVSSDYSSQDTVNSPVTPKMKENHIAVPDATAYDNEYLLFINSLSYLEKQTLLIIVDTHPELLKKLNQLAIDNNDMLEAVIDRINEKALNYIADNVIEFSEVPVVYEDYIEELKKALQEEKS